jgi:hypothetical protein
MRTAAPVRDRLYARLAPCPDPGCTCLLWGGYVDEKGYGRIWIGSKTDGTAHPERVHVVAWTVEEGSVPKGLVIDHVKDRGCRHRHCGNIAHLEPVTNRINILRGSAPPALQVTRERCPKKHPYDEANTYVNRNKRYCRACHRDSERERRTAATSP